MLRPLIQRPRRSAQLRPRERGVTLALVALAIFGIIAMAGLSIDIGTLYQASAEAQRAADAGALAGARFISMSGVTGDTTTKPPWVDVCGGKSSPASSIAVAVAQQNTVAGTTIPASAVTVTYSTQGITVSAGFSDCSQNSSAFAVNPMVTVQVTQTGLPTYFSRIWGRTGSSVSATATAEVFNPSNSGNYALGGNLVPVQPRCVKPWIVPNLDPGNLPGTCTGAGCPAFVDPATGSIKNPGIINAGAGVIGEQFNLVPDCASSPGNCNGGGGIPHNPPWVTPAGSLQYLPGQVIGSPVAVPSCGSTGSYQQAVAGCDQSTPYQCGVSGASTPNQVDFNENPGIPLGSGDTYVATQCLIHQVKGQDNLVTTSYPYQIQAGTGNLLGVSSSTVITSSNSIVSLPIYDGNGKTALTIKGNDADVNIVGFLQVFINQANADGSLVVTVLNVAGCSTGVSSGTPYLTGTSPVPIRLITAP
jgi:hypothetical protein